MKILLALIMTCPPLAFADDQPSLNEMVRSAHRLRDHLRENYVGTVLENTDNAIVEHFGQREWDHHAIKRILEARAESGLLALTELEDGFDRLNESLNQQNDRWEETAVQAMSKVSLAQALLVEANSIDRDARTLQTSWRSQCSPSLLKLSSNLLDPKSYMHLDRITSPDSLKINSNFSIQVTVVTDTSKFNPRGEVSPNMNAQPADAPIIAVGTGALYCGPIGVVVGVSILAGWALTKLGIFVEDLHYVARKEKQLLKYLQNIRDIQYQALENASQTVSPKVAEACQTNFPEKSADSLYSKLFESYRNHAAQTLERIKTKQSVLISKFSDRIEQLKTTYFPLLSNQFESAVALRFADTKKRAVLVHESFMNQFSKNLDDLNQASANTDRWKIKDRLWSELIVADGSFRIGEGFSFNAPFATSENAMLPDIWDQLSHSIKETMK